MYSAVLLFRILSGIIDVQMPLISEETITEVGLRLDAVAVVSDYVQLEKKGGRFWGRCPFHNEKTPSFTVDPDKKSYYCFGCHEGGSIVNFVMSLDKINFPQAIEKLCRRFGVPIIRKEGDVQILDDSLDKKQNDMFELYKRVAGTFHYFLCENEAGKMAKAYILGRGINDAMIERFNLGYAPAARSWLFGFLQKKGYSEAFLAESGLFGKQNQRAAFFSNRLIFPICDRQGRVAAFGGRILQGDGPKYLNSGESSLYKKRELLFALDLALPAIRKTKTAILVEGYMDVIAMHQGGVENAVAPLGTAFTEEQAKLLGRWVTQINLCFDQDEAGQNATVKGILCCRKAGVACAVIAGGDQSITTFKDPADILKEFGADHLKLFVKSVILDFEYLIAFGIKMFGTSDSQGKAKIAAFLFPFLDVIDSEVERSSYITGIGDAIATDPQLVLGDFKKWKKGQNIWQKPAVEGGKQESIKLTDELYLLTAVCVHFSANLEFWLDVRKALQIEDFSDLNAKELYIVLEECYRSETFDAGELLEKIKNDALKNFVVSKMNTDEFSKNPHRIIIGGIRHLEAKRVASEQQKVIAKMRVAQETGEDVEDLMQEKIYLDTKLLELKNC
ncbi:MAG: DNA primase [Termitinemataceae bacterium]|nr:MAG: DNA primase [Termitinemataceae bacterium]